MNDPLLLCEKYGFDGVVGAALVLHGSATGSRSGESQERLDAARHILILRTTNWIEPTTAFDSAVRSMLLAALDLDSYQRQNKEA